MKSKKINFIQQMEYSECGLACLAMLLNYYGHHVDLNELREEYPTPRGGYSLTNLMEIAAAKHLDTGAFYCNKENLSEVELPAILHWEGKHFVVLERIGKGSYVILDPANGRRRVSAEELSRKYTGYLMNGTPSVLFELRSRRKNHVLKHYLKKHYKSLCMVLFLTLVVQAIMVSIPLFTKWLVDHVLLITDIDGMGASGLMIAGMLTAFFIVTGARGVLISLIQTRLDHDIMHDFMETLLSLPYSFFDNRSSGDILFRANSNVYIREILSSNLIALFVDLILIVVYTIIMINYSIPLSIVLLVSSLLLGMMMYLNAKIIRKLVDDAIRDRVKVQSLSAEMIYNILDVKVLGIEQRLLSKWKQKYEKQLKSTQKMNIWESVIQTTTSAVQVILPIFILWLGGIIVIRGELSIGTLVAFSSIAGSYIAPVVSISNNYTQLVSLRVYFNRIIDVLRTKAEQPVREKLIQPKKLVGKIEFRNVSFRYNRFNSEVLRNVSFTIYPKESVAMVGYSGSGKSTVVKLLLGLNKPTQGEILIDDISIEQYDLSSLRSLIGAVLQEAQLFNGTIAENIKMNANVSEEEMISAAHKAHIYNDIMSTPLGFETIVTESGGNFSGGQRQRILLARAVVSSPDILLLDEATSSLDNITEKSIKDSIYRQESTKLILAHRLHTIKDVDKILFLHNGEIVESGSHEELMNLNGYYYELYYKKDIVAQPH